MATTRHAGGGARAVGGAIAAGAIALGLLVGGCATGDEGGEQGSPPAPSASDRAAPAPDRPSAPGADPAASSPAGASAFQLVSTSPDRLAQAASARFSATLRFEGSDAAPLGLPLAVEGAFAPGTGDGEFSMDLGDLGGTVVLRAVGGAAYVQPGGLLGSFLPDGVEWVHVDADAPDLAGTSLDPASLTAQFDALRGIAQDVEQVGPDEVRGVATTRYRVHVDPARAIERAPEEARDRLERAFAELELEPVPTDVWVDAEGMIRRFETRASVGGPGRSGPTAVMTLELWDFGVDLDLAAPPADATSSASDLLSEAFGVDVDLDALRELLGD